MFGGELGWVGLDDLGAAARSNEPGLLDKVKDVYNHLPSLAELRGTTAADRRKSNSHNHSSNSLLRHDIHLHLFLPSLSL